MGKWEREMKKERFLRTRIVLYLIIDLAMTIISLPICLVYVIVEYLSGKIYNRRPKLRYVTEKQFKSRVVKWYAGRFRGLYEEDVRRKQRA